MANFNGSDTVSDIFAGTDDGDTASGFGLNDTLFGLSGSDLLIGGSQNDSLDGGDDNDELRGEGQDDTLRGGMGDDTLLGGDGADLLDGGESNDNIITFAGESTVTDTVSGGNGNDVIDVRSLGIVDGGSGNDTVTLSGFLVKQGSLSGGSGALDRLVLKAQVVFDVASFDARAAGFEELVAGAVSGSDAANVVSFLGLLQDGFSNLLNFDAKGGDDSVTGNLYRDTLVGGIGKDTLLGMGGDDSLDGGFHDDRLDGGANNDTLIADAQGHDILIGGHGNDILQVGGNAEAYGGLGNDTVRVTNATVADDRLFADDPVGVAGTQDLLEWGGIARFTASSFSAKEAGFERLKVTFGIVGNEDANALDFADALVIGGTGIGIRVNEGDDLVRAPSASDQAGGSSDSVFGDGGNDTLFGNGGNDTLFGEEHDDSLDGGTGDDQLDGGSGDNVLAGQAGNDELSVQGFSAADGGAGNDTVILAFANIFSDSILGGLGADVLTVGANVTFADSFDFKGAGFEILQADNALNGAAGGNVLDFTNARVTGHPGARFVAAGGGDLVKAPDFTDHGASGSNDTVDGGAGNDTLFGNRGNDLLLGGDQTDRLEGGQGNDTLNDGNSGRDTLVGGDGNDTFVKHALSFVDGGDGNDTIQFIDALVTGSNAVGGEGVDTFTIGGTSTQFQRFDGSGQGFERYGGGSVSGTSGSDTIDLSGILNGSGAQGFLGGGSGNDSLVGGAGGWRVDGNDGDDRIGIGGGQTTVNAGDGNDSVSAGTRPSARNLMDGQSGLDGISFGDFDRGVKLDLADLDGQRLAPGAGDWRVFNIENAEGSRFDDVLKGSDFNNLLGGGAGKDRLSGGGGADTLKGGTGADTLQGGSDADVFDYDSIAESRSSATDRIIDFLTGDRIDISDIDAISGGGFNRFKWIGEGEFSSLGQARVVDAGSRLLLELNTEGTLAADAAIEILTLDQLDRGDIIFQGP